MRPAILKSSLLFGFSRQGFGAAVRGLRGLGLGLTDCVSLWSYWSLEPSWRFWAEWGHFSKRVASPGCVDALLDILRHDFVISDILSPTNNLLGALSYQTMNRGLELLWQQGTWTFKFEVSCDTVYFAILSNSIGVENWHPLLLNEYALTYLLFPSRSSLGNYYPSYKKPEQPQD